MASIQSILVYVGVDLVGDALMKLPFLRALRSGFPDARVTWVAGQDTSVFANVMQPAANGLIDEVIERADLGRSASELLRRPMGGRAFDLIIDTQKTLLTTLVLKRIPHRLFISGTAAFLLSDRRPRRGYRSPSHMVRRMLDLVELALGRPEPTPETISVDMDPAFSRGAGELLPPGPAFVGLAPGAGGRHKCWPVEKFIALARIQEERGRTPVFLIGPQEREWEEWLRVEVPTALFPLQAPGVADRFKGSPLFTIALGRCLRAAVCNDSGLGHMMASADTALVSLFGPTSPKKFSPLSRKLTVLTAQTWGGGDMALIPVDAAAAAVDKACSTPS
ncbi:MAG: glycosyltransferase family 9 protein [Alphaproteobacteria bacterium]|nr:glycosyltransferase family 9 protein [Alphaproteobacteria bacterium]